jgi:preprotein translocase subunit SecE
MAGFSLSNNRAVSYVKESKEELKKVSWPTRKVILRDTLLVIGISAAMAVFLGSLDYGLSKGFEMIIEKI